MPKPIPYGWLFVVSALAITVAVWLFGGNWYAYYDKGNGPEIKFQITEDVRLVGCTVIGLIAASIITALLRIAAYFRRP